MLHFRMGRDVRIEDEFGDVVFAMDGDLQHDSKEIPNFLRKLDEGYDLVTGWKYPRLDPISETFPSRIFNGLVNELTGLPHRPTISPL